MASLSEDECDLLKEKLRNLNPLGSYSTYNLEIYGFEFHLNASSIQEASVKFGFGLLRLKKLKSKDEGPVSFTCEDAVSRTKIAYNAFKILRDGTEYPLVVMNRYLHREEDSDIDEELENVSEAALPNIGNAPRNFEPANDLLISTLNNFFGYDNFRPLQKEIISETMSGNNVLGILGTGSGKSITFMLPAVLASHPTVVVMPTKSLIDDMFVRCQDLNIPACIFTGNIPKTTQVEQLENFSSYKLIFLTPEMLEGDLLNKIESVNIERIVFDEAHIITSWGSTFRPVYKQAASHMSRLKCPKLLLSATVPAKQQQQLTEIFGSLVIVRDSVFRDNLVLEVRERPAANKFYDELASYIENQDGCGIVYCVFSSDVAKIHAELLKRNINCAKYHGQLSESVKASNFSKWSSGEHRVMIANSAFGMGIDKADVRFVIHAKLPTTIDDYYQQCGRAGRDGQPAVCCMFYSHTDKMALLKMFKQNDQFEQQSKLLNDLIIFLEDLVECRHKRIMGYYGEDRDGFSCATSCDNCKNSDHYVITDGTSDALKVVQAVVELTGKKVTFNLLKLFLSGSSQKCVLENDLDSFSTYGSLQNKFVPVVMLQKFLNLLIYHDVLMEVGNLRNSSISVTVGLGCNAHKLMDYSLHVPKYEKI